LVGREDGIALTLDPFKISEPGIQVLERRPCARSLVALGILLQYPSIESYGGLADSLIQNERRARIIRAIRCTGLADCSACDGSYDSATRLILTVRAAVQSLGCSPD
jgi:hypothetical protein